MVNDKMTIIATKGTLDWAYPPFILASTAVAMNKKVTIFFTFYGLNLLLKNISNIKISPLGNPAMPMKIPSGPPWLQQINFAPMIPNLLWNIPFADNFATMMMKKTIAKKGVATIEELREICQESNVKLIACQMTVDLFNYQKEDFIDGIEFAGAASYMNEATPGGHHLYI